MCVGKETRRRRVIILQLVALSGRVHEWPQLPLDVCLGLLQRALADLVRPHLESGADFCELDLTVRRLDKDMVPT